MNPGASNKNLSCPTGQSDQAVGAVVEKGLDPARQAMDARTLLPHSTIHLFVRIKTFVVDARTGRRAVGR